MDLQLHMPCKIVQMRLWKFHFHSDIKTVKEEQLSIDDQRKKIKRIKRK